MVKGQGDHKLTDRQQELLARLRRGERGGRPDPIVRRQDSGPAPLSFAQQRLWFLDQFAPGNPAYNIPGAIRIKGPLSIAALQQSIYLLCRRHETLRTTFTTVGDEAVQVVASQPIVSLPVIDTRTWSDDELIRVMTDRARMPFDLRHGPLLSPTLYRRDVDDHVLLLVVHHIVFDGWSFGIMFDDIARLYGGVLAGREPELPPLPIQYADFAVWQCQAISGSRLDELLAYWSLQLADSPPTLEFPFDHVRPAELKFEGGENRFSVGKDVVEGLRRAAAPANATMFMTLLSAYAVLLFRYSGQEDIVIGTNIANRNRVELERMIGFFAGTLPMRMDLSGDPSFCSLLQRVRTLSLGAFEHQDLPFEKLVEHLHPQRDLSRNPLFQAMFVLQNAPRARLRAGNLEYSMIPVFAGTAKFDLWLSAVEERDRLDVTLEYDKQLLKTDTVERLIDNFLVLLAGIAEDPHRRLSRLPLLSAEEREQIVCSFNDTEVDYGDDDLIHQLVADRMIACSDRPILTFKDHSLTGREFLAERNRLAHWLRAAGVERGDIVGVLARRSVDMVIALHAVTASGGAYLPLAPDYPPARLEFCLEDAGVRVVICDRGLVDQLAGLDVNIICPQRDRQQLLSYPDQVPENINSSDDLAYVIYTSGSTGQPKGVMVPHRGICNRLHWMQDQYQLTAEDKVLQKTPYTFDVSVWEFFWPFIAGGELVVAVPEGHRDPEYLVNTIVDQGITIIHFVPSMLRLFLAHPQINTCRSLRLVVASGEALTPDLVQGLYGELPDVTLENLYGPTEASVDVTYWSCPREQLPAVIPIGYPVANTRLYIVDRHMQPVPIGVRGELYIGGVQVARGYLNRPDLTADRFVPSPFSDHEQDRLYRTGDLARYLSDGAMEFCGRVDFQVKLHGLRIELGEIEAAIRGLPTVHDVVVMLREDDGPGSASLVAYIVPDRTEVASAVNLQEKMVTDWQQVFDDAYSEAGDDVSFNIAGWNNSYDGEPIPAEQMMEWTVQTVNTVLTREPGTVLEIGAGTGLLLLRIAPHCDRYVGIDLSETALAAVQTAVDRLQLDGVELHCCPAHDVARFEPQSFDAVVLNSVVQYFPSVDYLLQVLSEVCKLVRPGGCIFIGDVRDHRLANILNNAVELARADDNLEVDHLRQRAQRRGMSDNELLLDPAFFYRLADELGVVGCPEVMKKPGRYDNELSRYRYDVVLPVGPVPEPRSISWRDYSAEMSGDWIKDLLISDQPQRLGISGIPDRRLAPEVKQASVVAGASPRESVGRVRWILSRSNAVGGLDPEDVRRAGQEAGYRVIVTPTAPGKDPAAFDAIYFRCSDEPIVLTERSGSGPLAELASAPLHDRLVRLLVPAVRTSLAAQLPDYMIPTSFVVLDELPSGASGKVDRKALPSPVVSGPSLEGNYRAPSTEVESILCAIIASVLSLERVGVEDNFFDLGLDSIRTIQVVSRARSAGIVLEPRSLFQHQDVAALAEVAVKATTLLAEQGAVTGTMNLTPGQQRYLRRGGDLEHYRVIRLSPRSEMNVELLEAALARLIDHHDGLRLDSDGDGYRLHLPSQHAPHRPLIVTAHDHGLSLAVRTVLVDEKSIRIVIEDLDTVYRQLKDGLPTNLPDKSVSIRRWSEHVAALGAGDNTECSGVIEVEHKSVVLPDETGQQLWEKDVLVLTAAAAAAASRELTTGEVVMELIADGRQLTKDDADTTRTVGDLSVAAQVVVDPALSAAELIRVVGHSAVAEEELVQEPSRRGLIQIIVVDQDWNAALWRSIDVDPQPLLPGDPGIRVVMRLERGQVVLDVDTDLSLYPGGTSEVFMDNMFRALTDTIKAEEPESAAVNDFSDFGWDETQVDAIAKALADHVDEE